MFSPNVVVGVTIMAVGLVLLLDRFGLTAAWDLLKFWPVVLVLFGASVAVQSLRRRDPAAPPPPRNVVSPGFVLFVLVIAFLGSNFISRAEPRGDSAEEINLIGIMGSTRRTSMSSDFGGATLGGVMGRSTLDLRQATIPPGEEAVVNVVALMGKVVLLVPEHWTVDTTALPIMGAVNDRRWPRREETTAGQDVEAPAPGNTPAAPADQPVEAPADQPVEAPANVEATAPPSTAPPSAAPRLVLRGFVMMGKVEIES
jgi:hypothetical protein